MYKRLFLMALAFLMILSVMPQTADAQEAIIGEWLWMVAHTEENQGGQNSTDIDSLAVASEDAVTEAMVATNGAKVGSKVGDYAWTLAVLPEDGNINTLVNELEGYPRGDDNAINDISSYALITLVSEEAQNDVTLGVSSDDSIKVWLNGTVVHTNATNRGRGAAGSYQDTVQVNLNAGDNLLMIKVSERGGGWGMFAGIDADVTYAYRPPVEHITGEWLWMVAHTEANQGGQASTDIDSLAAASNDAVTEAMVAENGATEGDSVGDYDWALAELPEDGNINTLVNELEGFPRGDDNAINDISSYALITLVAEEAMEDVVIGVSSDDSVKVWLNGEVVHTNATNRGRGGRASFQDKFKVSLNKGDNLLMIKISERGGGWGMYAGIGADVETAYRPASSDVGTAVEAGGKLVTTWGNLKSAK